MFYLPKLSNLNQNFKQLKEDRNTFLEQIGEYSKLSFSQVSQSNFLLVKIVKILN